ncbi:hypothetical protein BKA61DRAFT_653772 [Leptodontidium sp. MPI-SDFR-AT-0119]|nr:hypothetical protein BKA61DRAFT_653772 [Leptodontidium sp. MPI-SDFR-AT-0119]
MAGSLNTGTMKDNGNEGHLGWTIQQPNLVLINVGANNAGQNSGISTASGLYIDLLDKLWAGIPGATVILSTLLPNKNANTNARAVAINEQIRTTVASHSAGLNKRFAIADMNDGFITMTDLNDETYSLDSSYKKMASQMLDSLMLRQSRLSTTALRFTGTETVTTKFNEAAALIVGSMSMLLQIKLVNFGGTEVDEIIMANFTGKTWTWQFWVNNNNNDFAAGQPFDPGYSCPPNATRFADLNNDGLDDFVCIDTQGNLGASINEGGNPPIFRPYDIIGTSPPFWSSAYTVDLVYLADIDGDGRADYSFGVTNANSMVKFGRMYGTRRRDYIWVQAVPIIGNNLALTIQIHVWKNLGSGGTFLKGDGTYYCDMDGDGKDDYVWVGPNGLIDIYLNINNRPFWENHGFVITLGVSRKTIHFADLNGDGRCDLLSVDRNTGAVRMWLNNWNPGSRTWFFVDKGIVSGEARCTMGYGVIKNDLGVRFADLTGDGEADYLCIWPNGRVDGYLNRGMSSTGQVSFENINQIKSVTNYDRQNVRFHDVNGDGRADLLWINKYSGNTAIQINDGEIPSSGNHFYWGVRACASGNESGEDDVNMGDPGLHSYRDLGSCLDSDNDGSCEIDIDPNLGLTLPVDTILLPFQGAAQYSQGDAFLFDTPEMLSLTLSIVIAGEPIQWEDHGLCTPCNYLQGGPVATTPTRSLESSNHHYQLHSDWEPIENCTTQCLLLKNTPEHTWTPVGNGTYRGIYHELHFKHSGNFTVHRAYQGVNSGEISLSPRQYRTTTLQQPNGRPIHLDVYTRRDETKAYTSAFLGQRNPQQVAEWIGESVEESVAVSQRGSYSLHMAEYGDLLENDLDGTPNPNLWSRDLQRRVGSSTPYQILNIFDPNGDVVTFHRATYVNGANGQNLIDAGGDTHVYALSNPTDCVDGTVRSNQPLNGGVRVQAEHIVERVTVPYFFEFV